MNAESELLKDFKDALECINFESYNPNSAEFRTALSIGKMWRLVHKLNEGSDATPAETSVASDDEISSKIADAKRHLQKYLTTDNDVYKQICTDELAHADALAKLEMETADSERRQILLKYEDEVKAVAGQI